VENGVHSVKPLPLIALCALVFPAAANAGDVAMSSREISLGHERSLSAAAPPQRFNMLGVHWRGSGRVEFRVHRIHGAWSAWSDADDDASPDTASPERRAPVGIHAGNPMWTGSSDRVQFRTHGRITSLRAYYLWSRVSSEPLRRVQIADSPSIVTRAGWKADEKIRRGKTIYAPELRFAIVHHTAGSNSYTPEQSAAIVRGIEIYHVKGNGWNDIGYNFLVDKYGQVFEGRYGGLERNVVGAHSQGFNTGSVGVALIGNNSATAITPAQRQALVKLLSWRLDVAHIDPAGTVGVTSGGNPKYRAGKQVVLRVISGHRDTYPSECPGNAAYAQLGSIAAEVARTGLPKLYQPILTGTLGGPVRFQARLSSSIPWVVSVADAAGSVVGTGSGKGARVDWTWTPARTGGPFRWTIEGTGLRSAAGTLGGTLPPPPATLLSAVKPPPTLIPAVDGSVPPLHFDFTLGQPALVTIDVVDINGAVLARILSEERAAGVNAFDWYAASQLADGRYKLIVTAQVGAKIASIPLDLLVDRTVSGFALLQPVISPNGDGTNDRLTATFSLSAAVPVRLEIADAVGTVIATVAQTTLGPGPQLLEWDGLANGVSVPDGAFTARLTVTDAQGDVPVSLPFVIDLTPPVLKILDARNLKFSLTEAATVTLMVNDRRLIKLAPKGTFTVPRSVVVKTVTALPVDLAGNAGPLVSATVR
jgi:flagellar hook assembly protein FlgD